MQHPPKTKLTPRERRHQKMVATLTRWNKKLEQANKTIAKAVAIIPKLERQLQRYDMTMMANAPLPVRAEPVVETPVPQVTGKVGVEGDDIPEFGRRDKVEPAKPKRRRKTLSEATDEAVNKILIG
jgi:hypothetical protein